MVRRGDQDGVDVLLFQQPAVVAEPASVAGLRQGQVHLCPVDITYSRYVDSVVLLEIAHHAHSPVAAPDHSELDPVVGPEDAGVRSRGYGQGGGSEKVATVQVCGHGGI